LMRDLGGRPHWAKNFTYTSKTEIEAIYGDDMRKFMEVRDECDPDGMWLGEWHRRNLPVKQDMEVGGRSMVEKEVGRKKLGRGFGDGVLWTGERLVKTLQDSTGKSEVVEDEGEGDVREVKFEFNTRGDGNTDDDDDDGTPSPPATATSEESFDYMAKGEASVYAAE